LTWVLIWARISLTDEDLANETRKVIKNEYRVISTDKTKRQYSQDFKKDIEGQIKTKIKLAKTLRNKKQKSKQSLNQ
jgi:hypothetical protein